MASFATAAAFAAPIAPIASSRTQFVGKSASPTRRRSVAARATVRAEVRGQKPGGFPRTAEDRLAKKESEYRGPQGFTPYAEKVNGRLAQLGFVIGLVTEIASGKPIGQQILLMFSPLTQLAHNLIVLGASAHIDQILL